MLRATRTPQGWVVDFKGADNADEVRRLFGATVLPTPFRASAPWASVQAKLQELNPGETIIWE